MISYIGCSGYHYKEWKGEFYPEGLPSTKWLPYYAEHFNTIEINSSFYRMPTVKGLQKWYNDTPKDFTFTVKAYKVFTHYRRMNGIAEQQAIFNDTVFTALQDKLRCVLYQFPASVKYTPQLLELIMSSLSNIPVLHAIEFRDKSWWQPDVYNALQQAGLVFVNVSIPGMDDEFVPDSEHNYLRFHGKPVLYKSGYGAEALAPWAEKLKQHPTKELFVYFNNTWFMEAIKDGKIFRDMITTDF